MELIPTWTKKKRPRGFSYPIGAEALSAALQGVPQYPLLHLWFGGLERRSCWLKDKTWVEGEARVLEVSYFDGWTIFLHCVPGEHAKAAREQLLTVALPWIAAPLKATPLHPTHSIHTKPAFRLLACYDLAARIIRVRT